LPNRRCSALRLTEALTLPALTGILSAMLFPVFAAVDEADAAAEKPASTLNK